jgi:DNA helicase-2/ATP-dependent DNA helicase PcrA
MIIAKIHVTLKQSVLDPQGVAVSGALRQMGHKEVKGLRIGKYLELTLDDIVFQLAMNGDKDSQQEGGKVVVSTIHSSKGLEWQRVYLFGVYEGQLPHKMSQSEREVEEERRLFYVAVTRARKRLFLSYAHERFKYGQREGTIPSEFLDDIDARLMVHSRPKRSLLDEPFID